MQPADPISPVVGFEKPLLFHIRVAPSLNSVSVFRAFSHLIRVSLAASSSVDRKEKDVPAHDPICKSDQLISMSCFRPENTTASLFHAQLRLRTFVGDRGLY